MPEWLDLKENVTHLVMKRISGMVVANRMDTKVHFAPMLAHWFVLDALLIADEANSKGMHANALAATRPCVEAISIIELGICRHPLAESVLFQWNRGELTPGKVRAWLQDNVWPRYGSGLLLEPWSDFMREFAKAIQPYAHYAPELAQWQFRLHRFPDIRSANADNEAVIEVRPRAFDTQKATRIKLFHALLVYVLARISVAANGNDRDFSAAVTRFGIALGKSRYLDGEGSNWSPQFWASVWERGGGTILE